MHIVRVVSNVRVRSQSRRFSCCGIMHHFSRIKSRSFREISKEFLDSSDPIETLSRKFCGIFDCESRLVALASRHTPSHSKFFPLHEHSDLSRKTSRTRTICEIRLFSNFRVSVSKAVLEQLMPTRRKPFETTRTMCNVPPVTNSLDGPL